LIISANVSVYLMSKRFTIFYLKSVKDMVEEV